MYLRGVEIKEHDLSPKESPLYHIAVIDILNIWHETTSHPARGVNG